MAVASPPSSTMVETWKVLVGAAALMVFYALTAEVMAGALGESPSLVGLALAVVFGLLGWFLGQRLTEQFQE